MPRSSSSSSSSDEEREPRDAPLEVLEPNTDQDFFAEYRSLGDLREPYRIPPEFLRGILKHDAPQLPEAPTIAFINPRSGGRAGPSLSVALRRALGVTQVFDVGTHRPDMVLTALWANFQESPPSGDGNGGADRSRAQMVRSRMRVIAAGGDGTVAWILQSVERCNIVPPPAVAVIPLGTGNDLSRSFGWGASFDASWTKGFDKMYKNMLSVSNATPAPLDRWELIITAPGDGYFTRPMPYAFVDCKSGRPSKTAFSWNYVSVGMDAKAAHDFHHLREEKPKLAFSQAANKFWYGYYSCAGGWFCGAPPLNKKVHLELQDVKGGKWREVDVPPSVRAVVMLNLVSYGGGRNIWGKHDAEARKAGYSEAAVDDGKMEVVAFGNGWNAGVVIAGFGHCMRLGQAVGARLKISAPRRSKSCKDDPPRGKVYVQLDGEPWKQDVPVGEDGEPLEIEMTHHGISRMLVAPGFHQATSRQPAGSAAKVAATTQDATMVTTHAANAAAVEAHAAAHDAEEKANDADTRAWAAASQHDPDAAAHGVITSTSAPVPDPSAEEHEAPAHALVSSVHGGNAAGEDANVNDGPVSRALAEDDGGAADAASPTGKTRDTDVSGVMPVSAQGEEATA